MIVSTYEAARLSGISYRQADYWSRTGFIVPVDNGGGYGSRRAYDDVDVRRLTIARRLLDHGFTLDRVRTILNFSRETLTLFPHDDAYLIIADGHAVELVQLETMCARLAALATTATVISISREAL